MVRSTFSSFGSSSSFQFELIQKFSGEPVRSLGCPDVVVDGDEQTDAVLGQGIEIQERNVPDDLLVEEVGLGVGIARRDRKAEIEYRRK